MSIPEAGPSTELQFPAWNCLYQIRDFVRDVQDLRAECDGQSEELSWIDSNTRQSAPHPCSTLKLRYGVYANSEGPFSSVFNEDHAFLNFAMLLFYLPRERSRSVLLKFILPKGWKLATLLEEEGDAFLAPNFDALADSPAEAGHFEEYRYTQGVAPSGSLQLNSKAGLPTYRVIVHGDPAGYSAQRLLASLQAITAAETALMREAPFSRYTIILHFPSEGGGGGMEHRNGTAISVAEPALRENWGEFEGVVAHEFFHLWNVKRIRPQTLEPIDYIHGNDTSDLWFCEGVTSTYGQLTLLRAGLITSQVFYMRLAEAIRDLQERPARHFQSVELAGREAWLEKYPDYNRRERSISYYNKGELLGYFLDLSIRQASGNKASLDDVMRRLNEDFGRRGRFYTKADLRRTIIQLAPSFHDLDAFFMENVQGTRELDYDTYLGFAGLQLRIKTHEVADLGFSPFQSFEGPVQVESVERGSNAERAGLERGDTLLKMNGEPLSAAPNALSSRLRPGQPVRFQIRRGGRTLDLEYALGSTRETTYEVKEIHHPTEQQLRTREGWLKGETTSFGATIQAPRKSR
jgi:predicted metalloprotease with PDZ domain